MEEIRNRLVLDLDGTLCEISKAREGLATHKDWDRFHELGLQEDCIQSTLNLVWKIISESIHPVDVYVITGRSEAFRIGTAEWLHKYEICYEELLMRSIGDFRPGAVVKLELACQLPYTWDSTTAIDDDEKCIEMYKELGYATIKVG